MAKPREIAKNPPPAESEEESEEDESESEPEDTDTGKNTPAPSAAKMPETSKTTSASGGSASDASDEDEEEEEEEEESGSGSGSESDEGSPPRKNDFSIKPVAKPVTQQEKPAGKKALPKPNAPGPTSPTRNVSTSVGAKRAAAEAATPAGNADSKRAKKKTADDSDKKLAGTPSADEEKKLFARVFSEEDEIVLLNGIYDFIGKTKSDPFANFNEFHDFITKKIGDKSKAQVLDKMKRLKKRYENNAEKLLKSGKERTVSNHERNMYDVCKKIWGREGIAGNGETSDSIPKVPKKSVEANGSEVKKSRSELKMGKSLANVNRERSFSFAPDIGRLNAEWHLYEGTDLMEENDRIEMENKWKAFRLLEADLLIKKYGLMLQHMEKVHKGLKSRRS
ncbi:OLC1v1021872C1 [Oldenlandia corymbosa var. corymbosa]|uniref:OLC1v1021872C1 n=1 Tax=Oldenlandia corymbosa var. corymbosa TaxID=529605 RepID=A0AAV1BX95_OLDCO|nr:OLC1v1021872C1 [Oldenlandia corymbosa var. corymbosa]